MFFFFYNIISIVLLIPVILYHYYRSVSRGRRPAFAERFGFIPEAERARIGRRPVIWLHAVSVGEAIASRPLLKALRARYPGHAILLSSTTETGRAIAESFPEKDLCVYFPFDFLPAVRWALNSIRPAIVIIMETEIWPNFTREASQRGIPVVLANGRISDRSFRGYQRFAWFFRHPLRMFAQICMQSLADSERIMAIGAPAGTVVVAGNLKYDIPFRQIDPDERRTLRARYGIPGDLLVITAGSTHAGEDELVLTAYQALLAEGRNVFLALVPRHPERAGAVATLLENRAVAFRLRTALLPSDQAFRTGEVLLVDTIGEMMALYTLADLAFVGGSLAPTGGHNLLEPASVGVPSVFGPHMTNFRDITALVLQYGSGIQVENGAALTETLRNLVAAPTLRQVLGQNGLKMMRDNGGATERHMEVISCYL